MSRIHFARVIVIVLLCFVLIWGCGQKDESAKEKAESGIIVDDFEAYHDFCNRIFYTWVDGWGHSGDPDCGVPPCAGNRTCSTVGAVNAPFAEQAIVHGGGHSMPLAYDNTASPYYSEAQREWAAPQNWTGKDVKTLSLWFHGDPVNAAETLYVAVEDSAGQVRLATYPDQKGVLRATWQEWNIDLKQFSGVNLKSVQTLYIGLGNRISPQASGAGKVYIDDIRLY
jgi:hypothetical protein